MILMYIQVVYTCKPLQGISYYMYCAFQPELHTVPSQPVTAAACRVGYGNGLRLGILPVNSSSDPSSSHLGRP